MSCILSVIGLGKLGSSMLACFASKGFKTIGVDVNQESVDKVNSGQSPIYEPGVDELIKASMDRISATTDGREAAFNSDVSFIIVPTPSRKDGAFSTEYVERALTPIGLAIKAKHTYHLVVVTSTVMPGATERMAEMLEAISGKTLNEHFGVCYNPDFIALGKVVHDFLNPDMILIGESDAKAGDILEDIHRIVAHKENGSKTPEFHRMSFHNAELAKIGLNAYCTLKITFANVIGEICEAMPTGDAEKVLMAIGADRRVGKNYFKAGLGYSGTCFPRDCRAFQFHAESLAVSHTLAKATDAINDYHKEIRVPKILLEILKEKSTVKLSVLGTAFKENINVIEESSSVEVIKSLSRAGIQVNIYDPACNEITARELKGCRGLTFFDNAGDCIKDTVVCFIGTPWDEFKKLSVDFFTGGMSDPTIFDAWGIYKGTEIESSSGIDYRCIGRLNIGINRLVPFLRSE